MNKDNLHELINRYEAKIDKLYDKDNDELFKWRAMKTWREEWFEPEDSFPNFAERFTAAKKDFSLIIDNSRMHPSSGVLELWAREPHTIQHLFHDVLFADVQGDINAAQNNMDLFLEEYEKLRQRYCAAKWSYKQDRHSASVFMAMNEPAFHYVFKSSEALTMAKYIEFGFNIGAGSNFSLVNYYRLCDEIVAALKEHESLLDKHFDKLDKFGDACYKDQSLHMLAFDLMYCCRTYGYYKGLTVPSTGKVKKKANTIGPSAEELAQKEAERFAKIDAIEQEIAALEKSSDDCGDISLLGVQVTSTRYGTGTVIGQEINKIDVLFGDVQKSFILDKQFPARPRFEDDESIVEAFTKYGRAQEQIKRLQRELELLQNA